MFKLYKMHTSQNLSNECGIACINTILKMKGCSINYADLKSEFVISEDGITIVQIKDFFEKLNVKTKIYKNNILLFRKFESINKDQFPCIAVLKKQGKFHYIVIHRIKKNNYVYSDPADKTITKTRSFSFLNNVIYYMVFDFSNFNKKLLEEKISENNLKFYKSDIFNINYIKITVLNILIAILYIFISIKSGIYIDVVINGNSSIFYLSVFILTIVYMLIIAFEVLFTYFGQYITIKYVWKLTTKKSHYVIDSIIKQNYKNIKDLERGDVISRIDNYLIMYSDLMKYLLPILSKFLIILFSLFWMVRVNLKMLLIEIFYIIFDLLVLYSCYFKSYKLNYLTLEAQSEYSSILVETMSNFENINAESVKKYYKDKYNHQFNNFVKTNIQKDMFFNDISSIRLLLSFFNGILLIVFGIFVVNSNEMSIGDLTTSIILSSYLGNMSTDIVNIYLNIQNFMIVIERLLQIVQVNILDTKNIDCYAEKIKKITLKNYSLFYNDFLIQEANIEIATKNIVIKGKSGCGKTSFVKTIAGLENNYKGEILINNVNIMKYNEEFLKNRILYLSNKSYLCTGSIIENITFGKVVLDKHLENVCRDCDILEYINSLEDKFNTQINPNSNNLSEGQKQRIALARALIIEPDVLILDESLSNVDTISRSKIINNLNKYNIIKIYITHDDLTIYDGDLLYINKKHIEISKL